MNIRIFIRKEGVEENKRKENEKDNKKYIKKLKELGDFLFSWEMFSC